MKAPSGEGNAAALLLFLWHTAADWRKKACNAKSATAGGRHQDEMYPTSPAGVVIPTCVGRNRFVSRSCRQATAIWDGFVVSVDESLVKDDGDTEEISFNLCPAPHKAVICVHQVPCSHQNYHQSKATYARKQANTRVHVYMKIIEMI